MKSPIARLRPNASFVFAIFLLGPASLAFGHPGHGLISGFGPGFAHPLTGWDHVLAMIAVGIWAAQLGAPWIVSGAFLAMMSVGAVLGHLSGVVPGIDQGIAASIVVLGILIARSVQVPVVLADLIVGIFALFHGMAHGAEMPATAGGLAYGAGFVAATALLHLTGVVLCRRASRHSARIPQFSGWIIALAGCAIAVF